MLAALFEVPRVPGTWLRWSFDHLDSHDRIRQAIAAKGGPRLVSYPIDPIDEPHIADFLQYNAQLHSDMNTALRLSGVDLLTVDFKNEAEKIAWIAIHAQEHRDAETALGI
jgi:23S rRNA U2552 (ribose-2'-O)-methylase RlmE/FtsJ